MILLLLLLLILLSINESFKRRLVTGQLYSKVTGQKEKQIFHNCNRIIQYKDLLELMLRWISLYAILVFVHLLEGILRQPEEEL